VNRLLLALATLGPVGRAPVAPATAASVVVALAGWFIPPAPLWVAIVLLAAGSVIAAWICGRAEATLGHDAHPIVLDELVGQSIALLGAPHWWPAYLASVALFRLFDIWKPFGAQEAQELPGGSGVVADDVIAGLAACLALQLALWGLRLLGVWV